MGGRNRNKKTHKMERKKRKPKKSNIIITFFFLFQVQPSTTLDRNSDKTRIYNFPLSHATYFHGPLVAVTRYDREHPVYYTTIPSAPTQQLASGGRGRHGGGFWEVNGGGFSLPVVVAMPTVSNGSGIGSLKRGSKRRNMVVGLGDI